MSSESVERFRRALDRRAEEAEDLRERLRSARSLRDYIDVARSHPSERLQETANLGYSNIKRRR